LGGRPRTSGKTIRPVALRCATNGLFCIIDTEVSAILQ
jgi:hypothetical protein